MSGTNLIFNIINIIVACVVLICGIFQIVSSRFEGIVLGCFIIFFGIIILIIEIKPPSFLLVAFGFFQWWAGRGLFYIFLGCLCFPWSGKWTWELMLGLFMLIIGILWIVFHFLRIPMPTALSGSSYEKI